MIDSSWQFLYIPQLETVLIVSQLPSSSKLVQSGTKMVMEAGDVQGRLVAAYSTRQSFYKSKRFSFLISSCGLKLITNESSTDVDFKSEALSREDGGQLMT